MAKSESNFRKVNGGPEEALRRIDLGNRAGLLAQAYVIYNAWKREMAKHKGGFLSGAFVTGTAVNKITIGPILAIGRAGAYAIQIGTSLLYHLFWEVGHMNLFTGKYERVETLRPAAEDTVREQQLAFVRGFKQASGL